MFFVRTIDSDPMNSPVLYAIGFGDVPTHDMTTSAKPYQIRSVPTDAALFALRLNRTCVGGIPHTRKIQAISFLRTTLPGVTILEAKHAIEMALVLDVAQTENLLTKIDQARHAHDKAA